MNDNKELPFKIRTNYEIVHSLLVKSVQRVCKKRGVTLDGGAIGYYRYNSGPELLDSPRGMRIYPLMDDPISGLFPNDSDLAAKIWKAITDKRSYDRLGHFQLFAEKHDSDEHLELQIPESERINYGTEYFRINQIQYSVNEIREMLKGDFSESLKMKLGHDCNEVRNNFHKAIDHLFFQEGMTDLQVIPIPVLSTPSILLFLDSRNFTSSLEKDGKVSPYFIAELIAEASETVHFFLYNRLMQEFTKPNKDLTEIRFEAELFSEFAKSLFEILLPIKYKIDDQPERSYFEWYPLDDQKKHNQEILEFCYIDHSENERCSEPCIGRHKLTLWLPDFCVPEHSSSRKKPSIEWIQNQASYKIRLDRAHITLNNIYRLLYKNWDASQNALQKHRETVASQVNPILDHLTTIDVQSLSAILNDVEVATRGLSQTLESLRSGALENSYQIKLVGQGIWKIVFEGKEWFSKQDKPCQYLCIAIGKAKTGKGQITQGWQTIAKDHYSTDVTEIKGSVLRLLKELSGWEEKGAPLLKHFQNANFVTGTDAKGNVSSNKHLQNDLKYTPVRNVEWDLWKPDWAAGE